MNLIRSLVLLLLSISILTALGSGCASSQKKPAIPEEYANVVELTHPSGKNIAESTVYIDSAKIIEQNDDRYLLIMGNFPDGCTHISEAHHESGPGMPFIRLKAWRNTELMCTQALVAFSYIFKEFPESRLLQADSIQINDTEYPLTQ